MAGHDPHDDTRPDPEALKAGHEVDEVSSRPVVLFVIGLAMMVVLSFLAMALLFRSLSRREKLASPRLTTLEAADQGRLPPAPRLEVNPQGDYQIYKAAQDSILSGYAWVDPDSGRVRIPIDRAIDIIAARGLPHRAGVRLPHDLRLKPPVSAVEPAAGPPGKTGSHGGGH